MHILGLITYYCLPHLKLILKISIYVLLFKALGSLLSKRETASPIQ